MRKNHVKLMAVGMLVLAFMTGCDSNDNVINEISNSVVSTDMEGAGHNEGGQDSRNDTKPEQSEENKNSRSKAEAAEKKSQSQAAATSEENSRTQPQATAAAEDIEKELAAYRAEREKGVSSYGNYTMVMAPNEENYKYGVGFSDNELEFDSRERQLAYKAADDYVEGTLKLEGEIWGCVDPRMNAIYEDEDKGVANGYDAENIFLCEYNDNGKWQYLILVREKKGSDWKVLYHGSSYKTDESDGGDKD